MRLLSVAAIVLALSGCKADPQRVAQTESLLAEAGFHKTALIELRSYPVRQLFVRGTAEDHWYEYADPDFCRCSYVGGDKQIDALHALLEARR